MENQMKMNQLHFDYIKSEIELTLEKHGKELLVTAYEQGRFPRSENTRDLQLRFCFDLLYGAGLCQYMSDKVYPYLNDDHVYTALKKICPTVTRKY
jgi:hypothetical protein